MNKPPAISLKAGEFFTRCADIEDRGGWEYQHPCDGEWSDDPAYFKDVWGGTILLARARLSSPDEGLTEQ